MASEGIKAVFQTTRPPFLVLAPICIGLAASLANFDQPSQITKLSLILLAGLLAHVSVNTFNEYFDFHSGLDGLTSKTPFSGGSGALIQTPEADKKVLAIAVLSLLATIAIGLFLFTVAGWQLLPLGVIGVLLILLYTSWINTKPMLCLLAPGLAFGPLMMFGTEIVLRTEVSFAGVLLSFSPFFMVNNLLLINQLPDQYADEKVGRVTFPIRFGSEWSLRVYLIFTLLAAASLIAFGLLNMQMMVLLALVPWSLTLVTWAQLRIAKEEQVHIPAMGLNVVATLLTPLTTGLVLIFT